ncbi:helix-turn-helix transcriptional regulator [Streptomyces graminilatus]|uniref:helix-turn-helix transcriptional regulator n=1 Tax=Streptomyces graminilatus TaxID=1464070 RepID=UPI000A3F71E5|nr:helix-turn-helix domain-containing protein [Streptomyces graminilatus]
MTVTEIAAEHGVSRQTIHTYRRTGGFPQPVEGEGSTRPRFNASEVDAFFKANPKQPGKKRTDPASPPEQGVQVTAATEHAETTSAWLPATETTEHGLRLRDGTLLTFDTLSERAKRQAEFEKAEWEVTPLVRRRRVQLTEWTEE